MNLQFVVMDTMNAVPRAKSYGMICSRSFMTGFAQIKNCLIKVKTSSAPP